MDLIRLLLLHCEGIEKVDLSDYSQDQIAYHKALIIDAGLARGAVTIKWTAAEIIGLNWAGHDFLDAARNESIWQQMKKKLKDSALELPLDLIKEILVGILKDRLNL